MCYYRDKQSINKFRIIKATAAGVTLTEPFALETNWHYKVRILRCAADQNFALAVFCCEAYFCLPCSDSPKCFAPLALHDRLHMSMSLTPAACRRS